MNKEFVRIDNQTGLEEELSEEEVRMRITNTDLENLIKNLRSGIPYKTTFAEWKIK